MDRWIYGFRPRDRQTFMDRTNRYTYSQKEDNRQIDKQIQDDRWDRYIDT